VLIRLSPAPRALIVFQLRFLGSAAIQDRKNRRHDPLSSSPAAFLQEGWHPTWEETERRTETHRFFRMTKPFFKGGESKWILYGWDTRLLFSMNFHVDKKNYRAEFL
jgi:hypothetical protein